MKWGWRGVVKTDDVIKETTKEPQGALSLGINLRKPTKLDLRTRNESRPRIYAHPL